MLRIKDIPFLGTKNVRKDRKKGSPSALDNHYPVTEKLFLPAT